MRIVLVDLRPRPGPARPMNFFGLAPVELVHWLERTLLDLASHPDSPLVLVAGHYPLAYVKSEMSSVTGRGFAQVLDESCASAYLNGHLHTLGGYMDKLYARRPGGLLELEVGDLKDNGRFRVIVVDENRFAFADATLDEWPVAVVTQPADSRFALRGQAAPRWRDAEHGTLRVHLFSPEPLVAAAVSARLDGYPVKASFARAVGEDDEHLFLMHWPADVLQELEVQGGVHMLDILYNDRRINRVQFDASADAPAYRPLNWMQSSFLQLNAPVIMQGLCELGLCTTALLVLLLPFLAHHVPRIIRLVHNVLPQFAATFVDGVVIIGTYDPVVRFGLALYCAYCFAMPWFAGEWLVGHTGWFYLKGLTIDG